MAKRVLYVVAAVAGANSSWWLLWSGRSGLVAAVVWCEWRGGCCGLVGIAQWLLLPSGCCGLMAALVGW